MSPTSRRTVVSLTTVLAAALALTGCAPGSPADEPPPATGDDSATDPLDCLVGGPWELDLADYAAQAEPWMAGLGIPISDFTMSGRQTVQFTSDGLMSVVTDVVSAGTLHTRDGDVAVSVPSTLGGSGDFSMNGASMMTIENWSNDTPVAEAADDEGFTSPVLDFSTIDSVGVTCQPGLLSLTAPDSPFVPLFHR